MKAAILLIVVLAIAASAVMRSKISHLEMQEAELRAGQIAAGSSGVAFEPTLPATKQERPDRPTLDLRDYLAKYRKLKSAAKLPSEAEQTMIELELGSVPPRELARLAALLPEAGVPDGYHRDLYQHASSRLIDHAPDLATEFALMGGDLRCFNFVIRQWISRDPEAAGSWLEKKSKGDPPLNESSLTTYPGHPEPLDVPRLRLAASIAAAPGGEGLTTLMELQGSELTRALDDVAKVIPSAKLPELLQRMGENARADLIVTILKHYPDAALAREHLESSNLPPDQFLKAATTVVAGLDPADMHRGMEWFLRTTDPARREEGVKEIVNAWTKENPRSAKLWLEQLPSGSDRLAAAAAYSESLKHPQKRPPPDPF